MQKKSKPRYFNGLKVTDASAPLTIEVTTADVKKAKRKNPGHCVLAEACRRQFKSANVVILRRTAYVELPGPGRGATPRFKRFFINRDVSEKIGVFDKTGKMDRGGFTLTPPAPSCQLETMRKYHYTRKQAINDGLLKVKPRGRNKKTSPRRGILEVRNGQGQMHFTGSAA